MIYRLVATRNDILAKSDNLHIQAVLFDLDDTLHDRTQAFRQWAEDFLSLQGIQDIQIIQDHDAALEWLISVDQNGYCPRAEFAATVMERFPNTGERSIREFVTAFQLGLVSKMSLTAGASLLLDALRIHAIPWGIVTNGTTRQQTRKIEHLGLTGQAKCVMISEAFGTKKPHPDIFLAAAEKIGTNPTEILFVGDHPVNDILGARQVGMKTAWVRCISHDLI